jgi:sn-glycerol 3-phosphate transport system ATP-binding protein
MAEISLHGVTKSFGRNEVIHRTDVTIADGEFVVIVGPSGCGKSTVLRMIAGLETATEGEVRIAGKRVNEVEPKDRNIAMVFQNYALYPHMTVYENMSYGLRIRRMPREEIRQRVAMGRAIVRQPAAFLFDEPLSNLDAKLRVQMRLEIQKLHRELRTTSVYVTHDQVEAMTLADRMIVINAGTVEQVGAPIEVYDDPATQFVAGFIGSPSMNFLPGKRVGDGVDVSGGVRVPLPEGLRSTAPEGLVVGIRPEHFALGKEGGIPFLLKVETIEALGADSLVHAVFDGTLLVARIDGHVTPAAGEVLPFSVAPAKLYFFDAATGKRLRPAAA